MKLKHTKISEEFAHYIMNELLAKSYLTKLGMPIILLMIVH